jgi:type IV pilus assembly protein PilB
MGFNVDAVVADTAEIDGLLKKHYSKAESVADVVSALATDEKLQKLVGMGAGGKSIDLDAVIEATEDNKVIKLLNLVLMQAIKDRASDSTSSRSRKSSRDAYRIDGFV